VTSGGRWSPRSSTSRNGPPRALLRLALWASVAVVGLPAALPAQPLVVQGAYGLDVRRFSAERGEAVLDGQAATLSLGIAGFVSPRWTAGIDLDLGADASESRSVTVPLPGRPPTVTTTYTLRRRSVAALAGFHTAPDRRVRLGCYAGLSFSALRRTVSSDAPPIVLAEPPGPSVFLDRTASPIVGIDVAVSVAPRLALVAAVRAQALAASGDLTGFAVRPAAGMRLAF
jgi:hypothetical protein